MRSIQITQQGLSARGEGGLPLLFPRRRMGRADARAHGKRHSDRRDRQSRSRRVVRARHVSGAVWRLPSDHLKVGETVLVSGATGNFAAAAVAVALAMGAGCMVASRRNQAALDELQRRFGARVRIVPMLGEENGDRARMLAAAPGPIDCVFDILPPTASAVQPRAAIMAVRP